MTTKDQFELWYSRKYPYDKRTEILQIAYEAWVESRSLLKDELPLSFTDVKPYACYENGWNDMRGEIIHLIENLD